MLSRRRPTRRDVLIGAGTAALTAWGAGRAQSLKPSLDEDLSAGLRVRASKQGLLYGAATSTYQLGQDDFAAALVRESSILVAEYEMKRDALEPSRGHYDFAAADALSRFAHDHRMAFRGHTLVWHASNPKWLDASAFSAKDERLLTTYIAAIAGHFRGRVQSWDVVNEVLLPKDGRADAMRASPWLSAFGPAYVDLAFHAARAADPDALLVYNDWGCEAGAAENDAFRRATLKFLEGLRARNVPVGALGLQGHLAAFGTPVDQKKLGAFLGEVNAMGLKILVTEHDVDDSGGPSDIALRDRAVADASRRFLDVVLASSATVAVLTWGLSDRFLDAPGLRAMLSGYRPRMLPLDTDLARKPMWLAMASAFDRAR
jgi:endo-1,4-beta-xylanase